MNYFTKVIFGGYALIEGFILSCLKDETINFFNSRKNTIRYKKKFKSFGKNTLITGPFRNLVGSQYINIGQDCRIRENVRLTAWDKHQEQMFTPQILIGDNCSLGSDAHITCINKIVIGNSVRMGDKVLITDNSHGNTDLESLKIPPHQRTLISKGPIIIKDKVWIGEKATILPGITIGESSVIAANSVVTKDVPPFSVVAGNPAKIIKTFSNKA